MSEENKIFDIPSNTDEKAVEAAAAAVEKKDEIQAVASAPLIAPAPISVSDATAPVDAAVVAAKEESAAATEAAIAASAKAAKNSEKDAAKAAAKAAKEAEKAQAAQEKAARKEAEKSAKKAEAAEKKAARNQEKAAEAQAKIDACPPEYRPVSTSKFFWFAFLSFLPVFGIIFTIITSIFPKNRNIKNFERAILILFIIELILTLIALIVAVFVNGSSIDGIIDAFLLFFDELFG